MTAPVIDLAERRAARITAQISNLSEAFLLTLEAALEDACDDIDSANVNGRPAEEFLDRCVECIERVRSWK